MCEIRQSSESGVLECGVRLAEPRASASDDSRYIRQFASWVTNQWKVAFGALIDFPWRMRSR